MQLAIVFMRNYFFPCLLSLVFLGLGFNNAHKKLSLQEKLSTADYLIISFGLFWLTIVFIMLCVDFVDFLKRKKSR